MSFEVAAEAYDRFMGRYSALLSPQLADLAGVTVGTHVLDVGCGPGALVGELVARVGADLVTAADPSEPFVTAARTRYPGVTVEQAPAERLPFDDDAFDVALAQLVVHFMQDPVAGLREMARVTRGGGVVAASVWDLAGGRAPLSVYWEAARSVDAGAIDESGLAGTREGHLAGLFAAAGLASSRRRPRPCARSSRPSTSGGSRTRSASALRARTRPGSTPGCGSASARRAAPGCPSRRSR